MHSSLDTLFEKQQSIYLNAFKHPMAQQELQLTGADRPFEAGMLVVLKYPPELTERLHQASLAVASTIPALTYAPEALYTTVAVGPKLHDLTDHEASKSELQFSSWFFEEGLALGQSLTERIQITFTEWLYNSNTLIAASKANQHFWQLADQLVSSANKRSIRSAMPWGSHVTVSRFLADKTPASVMREPLSQLPALPTKAITPQGLELVHYECDSHGFRLRNRDFWNS